MFEFIPLRACVLEFDYLCIQSQLSLAALLDAISLPPHPAQLERICLQQAALALEKEKLESEAAVAK